MRWSIRTKILLILSSLLLLVVLAYLVLAEKILREDRELLVFDTNRVATEQIANELDGSLRRVVDKMEVLSELLINNPSLSQTGKQLAQTFFEKDPDLIALQLTSISGMAHTVTGELISNKKLHSLGIQIGQVRFQNTLPPPRQNGHEEDIEVENRSIPSAILYLVRIPLKVGEVGAKKMLYAQGLIDGRRWQESFLDNQTLALNFVVTNSGEVFAHPNTNWVTTRKNLSHFGIVQQARSQSFAIQQIEFEVEKVNYIGLYRKTTVGALTVVSMIDKGTALLASRLLFEKTILLSFIIVTLVLLISLFFSGSLSSPLLSLIDATRQIAQGNFETPIEVHTQDEIGVLATAFSQMVKELKSSRILLEDYSRGLEQKVHERTLELESKNAAIRQQQEDMLRSTRLAAVGELAGQASHEVLNPLTAMISNLESLILRATQFRDSPTAPAAVFRAILESWRSTYEAAGFQGWLEDMKKPSKLLPGKSMTEEDLGNLTNILNHLNQFNDKLKLDLGVILSESHRIGRIVDRMRGLSRMSRIPTKLDVNALIIDCVQVTEDLFSRFNITIETNLDLQPLYMLGDSDEMRQVFYNLFKNSMDAIQERRKFPEYKSEFESKDLIRVKTKASETQICISLWDNGIGVPVDNRQKIFETSFTTKGPNGSGLGLGISKRFIHESGGEINLSGTEVGRFTEFEITLPRIHLHKELESS